EEAKGKGGVKIPELPDWTEEEAEVAEETVLEQVGQPRVRRGKTLFEKWLERRRKKKGEPERPPFDGRPFDQEGGRGFMGRSEDDL
ncbi:unnamed protein product, partial [marine sediment metagenome]